MAPAKKNKSKILYSTLPKTGGGGVGMKFRQPGETTKEMAKGTRPCAEATTVQQILLMMIVHLCRKVVYGLDISYRIGMYVLGTLLISVMADYRSTAPERKSKSYFADESNFLNQYFVKLGWGWTITVVGAFVYFTSKTYGCGRINIIRNNLMRLVIATAVWYSFTSLFDLIEEKTGLCESRKFRQKEGCLEAGLRWKGFDISGHSFILIWSNFVIFEEGKAYVGWERIKDFLRNEEHRRTQTVNDEEAETALTKLKNDEFLHLRSNYTAATPYVRILFCLMAVFMILWDFMLICTVFYFHIMIEKVVASGVAVVLWFFFYKFAYKQPLSPGLPGEGLFKYVSFTDAASKTCRRHSMRSPHTKNNSSGGNNTKWSSKEEVPKFMGMPLYALKDYKEAEVEDLGPVDQGVSGASIDRNNIVRPLGRARSRSSSRARMSKSSINSLNYKW